MKKILVAIVIVTLLLNPSLIVGATESQTSTQQILEGKETVPQKADNIEEDQTAKNQVELEKTTEEKKEEAPSEKAIQEEVPSEEEKKEEVPSEEAIQEEIPIV